MVSALDFKTAEEVHDILVNPPADGRYESLKKALIKVFGKSQAQRDDELLNLTGLGDKNPTALLRKINSLNDDPKTIKRALFLSNLSAKSGPHNHRWSGFCGSGKAGRNC